MRVLGFMTGTSLDAVDMAVLDTDGLSISGFGPAGERKLSEATRDLLLETTRQALAWTRGTPEPSIFDEARRAVADEHLAAAEDFLGREGLRWSDFDLVGVHGQTVLHERPKAGSPGRTVQLIDAQAVADRIRVPVVHDFRTADVAAGGEGAPLAPAYHVARAEASGAERPIAVLNVGGVANVTLIPRSGDPVAFDTGPGNGMLDLMVQNRGLGRMDEGGRLAGAGRVDEHALAILLGHPYFSARPPKSLDRYDFSLSPLGGLSAEDAAATLVAFMADAVGRSFEHARDRPGQLIVCGGGRHNPQIMAALRSRLPVPVLAAEALGWRGDAIEAEAFAFLAARSARGLPLSWPTTTGVPGPQPGGRIANPVTSA